MALALVEAGARAVYCVDLPKTPGEEWTKVREYAEAQGGKTGGEGRLEYVSADVRDQVRRVLRIASAREGEVRDDGYLLLDFVGAGRDVEDRGDGWRQGGEDGCVCCCCGDTPEGRDPLLDVLGRAVPRGERAARVLWCRPALKLVIADPQRERQRCSFHGSSGWPADGTFRQRREHHLDC